MNETAQWLSDLVTGIVEFPDDVSVSTQSDEMGVLFTIKVNPTDAGKILGKNGVTTKSIRTILRVKGFKHHVRASLRLDIPPAPDKQY